MNQTFRVYFLYSLLALLVSGIMTSLSHLNVNYVAPYIFLSSFAFVFALAFDGHKTSRLVGTSLITALVITFPFLSLDFSPHVSGHTPHQLKYMEFIFFSLPSFAFMVHCFHYAFHKTNDYHLDYRYLFEAVWNTIPMLFIAGIFANITNLLIMFAAFGFKTIHNQFLEIYYINNVDVLFILNSMFFFIGLSIAKLHDKITLNLRFVLLRMLGFLLPLLILTTFTYIVMFFIFHGQQAFSLHAITGTTTLTTMAFLGIIFFNAYYQDGEKEHAFRLPIMIIYKFYLVLLAIIALYSGVQILMSYHHLLSYNLQLYFFLLMLYPIAYAVSVFFKKSTAIAIITRSNMLISIIYIVLLMIIYHPFQSQHHTLPMVNTTVNIKTISKKTNDSTNKIKSTNSIKMQSH